METPRILILRFKDTLHKDEVGLFRGAVLNKIKENSDVLFHNHTEEGFRYAYPLIQYKRINQKAAIICLNQGVDVIGKVFSAAGNELNIGNRTIRLEIDSVQPSKFRIQVWDQLTTYQIRKWLPLNQKNLEQYNMLPGIGSKYEFLEKILTGNILSCAKGLGIHFDKKITCHITQADEPYMVKYKGVSFISFDLQFKCNVSLPNYIGLGKGSSLNHGTICRLKD